MAAKIACVNFFECWLLFLLMDYLLLTACFVEQKTCKMYSS